METAGAAKDKRVEIALRAWAPRFVASGVPLADFEEVTGSITRFFGLQGGYRALSADYLLDSDTGDLEMKGPYFGAMVRF